ncbi:MAG TPA: ABC transporter ATP-binding protein [Chloroflexia bacterium]|nr:ABC transporter ATP-binding protein [Chloroflexia bacterium]
MVAGQSQQVQVQAYQATGTQDGPPMIQVSNASKIIDDKRIVDELNFEVKQGEIFGFIGPSGSGKTSTIRLLTGVYEPTEGEVRVMGEIPSHPSRSVKERFGYMPQLFVLFPNLTVRENLNFVSGLYGMNPFTRRKRVDELLRFVELWEARDRVAVNISGGMQRRLELAASLLHNPPLLFADEPTAGIDPVLRGKFWEEFRRLRDEGRTIFVTTQYVGESEYCDRVGVIRKGHIVALDTPLALRRQALGGDVVDFAADNLNGAALLNLMQLEGVKEVRPVSRTEARVYVDEAAAAIPVLLDALSSSQCTVSRIEEYRPSFDEVFVELMKRDAATRGETEDGEEVADASST